MSDSPRLPTRLPRSRQDPITDAPTALALFGASITRPWRTETILIPLDAEHRGQVIVVIDGTDDLELVLDRTLPSLLGARASPASLVVASLLAATVSLHPGPGPRSDYSEPSGDPWDNRWADRWLAAADTADGANCPLREWFVLGPSGPWCPRDVLGVPPRWP